ncbi:MAG: hypothetical protein ACYTG0_22495 [Planctomycetota bacterium]|jgi:hypothetical protein
MCSGNRQSIFKRVRWRLLPLAIAVAGAASTAAGETSRLEEIQSRLEQQQTKIECLHLRIRRETTLSVDPGVIRGWPSPPSLPRHLGADEVLIAFKGDNRYLRLLELDYRPAIPPSEPSRETQLLTLYLDEAKAWTGKAVLERNRDLQSGEYEYRSVPAESARDRFPPAEYLRNVGLAVPDPTAKDDARRNLQQMGLLSEAIRRWPYRVLERTEAIDDVPCVVLEGVMECRLPAGDASQPQEISDKLWLDPKHGLALRKRETQIAGQLVRVLNSDFAEVLPGFWLPKLSRTEAFPPPEAPKEHRNRPALVRRMKLLFWVVNRVPDDLFDVALTPRKYPGEFGLVPAYHMRVVPVDERPPEARSDQEVWAEEVWAVKGVGHRRESHVGSKLERLRVETNRWCFFWHPARGRVVATPSLVGDPEAGRRTGIKERAEFVRRWEKSTAVFACERERLSGREVDKITAFFPVNPRRSGDTLYDFSPGDYRKTSATEFVTREAWFDLTTHLRLRYRCGCRPPKHQNWDEYPPPESVPRELFKFQVPRDAELIVVDPALGRHVQSEGQEEPDLRE